MTATQTPIATLTVEEASPANKLVVFKHSSSLNKVDFTFILLFSQITMAEIWFKTV